MSFFRRKTGLLAVLVLTVASLSPAVLRAADLSVLNNPQLSQSAVDARGHIHTVWSAIGASGSELFYQRINPYQVGPASPVISIARSESRLKRPHIKLGDDGLVHLLWQERYMRPAGSKNKQGTWIHYARFYSGEVEKTGRFSRSILNSRPSALHPDFAVDASKNAWVVWEEGAGDLKLVKINRDGRLSRPQTITVSDKTRVNAFPVIAADEKGNLHLAWTGQSKGRTDSMVYAVIDRVNFRPVIAERAVHTVPAAAGQRKSLSVTRTGEVRLGWKAKNEEGRLDINVPESGYLLIQPVHSNMGPVLQAMPIGEHVKVVDRKLRNKKKDPLDFQIHGILSKKPGHSPLGLRGRLSVPVWSDIPSLAEGNRDVEQSKRHMMLAFSSWSAAPPPSGKHSSPVTAARLASPGTASLQSYFPEVKHMSYLSIPITRGEVRNNKYFSTSQTNQAGLI